MKPFSFIKPPFYLRVSLVLPSAFLIIAGSPVITMLIARHRLDSLLSGFLSFGVVKWLMFLRPWAVIGGAVGLIASGIALKMNEENRMKAGAAIFLNTCVLILAIGIKYSSYFNYQSTLAANGVPGILSEALSKMGNNNDVEQMFLAPGGPSADVNRTGGLDENTVRQAMNAMQSLLAGALKDASLNDAMNSVLKNGAGPNAANHNNGSSMSMEEILKLQDGGK